jgi:hypothetical protein
MVPSYAAVIFGFPDQYGVNDMSKNVGGIDRILRIVVGLALIGLTLAGIIGMWGWIGVVPLATAAIGWCPAYLPFGIKTCKMG